MFNVTIETSFFCLCHDDDDDDGVAASVVAVVAVVVAVAVAVAVVGRIKSVSWRWKTCERKKRHRKGRREMNFAHISTHADANRMSLATASFAYRRPHLHAQPWLPAQKKQQQQQQHRPKMTSQSPHYTRITAKAETFNQSINPNHHRNEAKRTARRRSIGNEFACRSPYLHTKRHRNREPKKKKSQQKSRDKAITYRQTMAPVRR